MVAGPGDGVAAAAAGRGRLRVSHADREQVIDIVKAAFVRARWARTNSTCGRPGVRVADLRGTGRVTTDLPASRPQPSRPGSPGPRARAASSAARAGNAGGDHALRRVWGFTFLPPWPANSEGDPPHALILLFFSANLMYLVVMIMAVDL